MGEALKSGKLIGCDIPNRKHELKETTMKNRREKNRVKRPLRTLIVTAAFVWLNVATAMFGQANVDDGKKASTLSPARTAFERLKKLEGNWKGRSTKGWEEATSYKTIAQGTVVVGTSFDAHP